LATWLAPLAGLGCAGRSERLAQPLHYRAPMRKNFNRSFDSAFGGKANIQPERPDVCF